MNGEMLVVSYVFDSYKDYIPSYVYSILRSYPSYFVKIFVSDKLTPRQNKCLEIIRSGLSDRFEIVEDFYISGPLHNTSCCRWFIGGEYFSRFKYAYIGDIDFIIVNENPDILSAHLKHATEILHFPYSNIVRENTDKMSGLHFVIVDEYFKKMQPIIDKYKMSPPMAITHHGKTVNEQLLYAMVKEGIGLPPLNIKEYRPHHGLHLGLLRGDKSVPDALCKSEWKQYVQGAIPIMAGHLYNRLVKNCENPVIRRILEVAQTYITKQPI